MDEAATDGPFVSAPAWPALPRFLAPFLEVLDDKARPRREPTRRSLMQYGVATRCRAYRRDRDCDPGPAQEPANRGKTRKVFVRAKHYIWEGLR
jgi:hypothetical protein